MYIQANIGRNVAMVEALTNEPTGSVEPMGDTAWANFQKDVKEEIFLAVHDSSIVAALEINMSDFQVHTGMGEWNGVAEESAHVSIYFDHDGRVYNDLLNTWSDLKVAIDANLSSRLSYLAFQYGQDAIAYVVTDSHLATR